MTITFSCPNCGRKILERDDFAGRATKCSDCGELVRIPDASPGPLPSRVPVQKVAVPPQPTVGDKLIERAHALLLKDFGAVSKHSRRDEYEFPPYTFVGVLGILLIVVGCIVGFFAWNMDTTVESGGKTIDIGALSTNLPTSRVHNIGLMAERQNRLILSGILSLAGILLVGFSTLAQDQAKARQEPTGPERQQNRR